MQIKKITITNFRSYYQTSIFDISEGMTLIIGDNGDGKTTFFEALEWLFDTNYVLPKADTKYISQKRRNQMLLGESDTVRVSMDFEHKGYMYSLERSFSFAVNNNNAVNVSNFNYTLFYQNGSERRSQDGKYFENLFDTAIRRYSLFKGESELNIFNRQETINLMVDTFSEVKNFKPFVEFTEKAKDNSNRAKENALDKDKKNAQKAKSLKYQLDDYNLRIEKMKDELKQKQTEATNFATLLENMEQNKEAAAQLKTVNERISSLSEKNRQLSRYIKEDYTIRLLDDMWVLCGFAPIAKEYNEKINKIGIERRKQEIKFQKEQGAQQAIKHVQETLKNGTTPLPIYVPNEQTMREMLHDQICKVCGREAPVGSEAYNFMQKRLDEYLNSLHLNKDEEEVRLFIHDYSEELDKRATILHNDMSSFIQLPEVIKDAIEFVESRKKDRQLLEANIAAAEEDKKKILAQTQGVTENDLQVAYANISNLWSLKSEAEKRIIELKAILAKTKEERDEVQEQYDKISLDSIAKNLVNLSMAIRKIHEAFDSARLQNKRNFLEDLEKYANEYMSKLNLEDFTGVIKLVEMPNGIVVIELQDVNGNRIFNPNTALKTTMYMAVLFAVSKLTTLKRDSDYPLIFDAPTSSFADAKESDFYRVISGVNKQTIIVTKSFLKEGTNGRNEIDMQKIQQISGNVYRIEKMRPFDPQDLSTIQTVALKIK